MFIGHIFPREPLLYHDYYSWNRTFIKLSRAEGNVIEIEEAKEKPPGIRAIQLLTQLHAFIATSYQPHLNKCTIKLTCLNASESCIFHHLPDASQAFNQIVLRVLLGYEIAYHNPRRVSLCKRIQNAIYLLFGWETERDKLHKISINIQRTLHDACEGVFPASRAFYHKEAEYLKGLIKKVESGK